jgi:hypothetical protein
MAMFGWTDPKMPARSNPRKKLSDFSAKRGFIDALGRLSPIGGCWGCGIVRSPQLYHHNPH